MNYRLLPKTPWSVSEIGFGCMSLDVKDSASGSLIQSAFDQGVNYFDTADLYDRGENETLLGNALKPFRKEVLVATKVGNEWLPDGTGWRWNPTKAYILEAVDKSLTRLQTDYIDLYQLHGGTSEDSRDEVIEAFELLKKAGKIRFYGISSIRPNVIKPYAAYSEIVSNMLQYSLLDRRPEESVLDFLYEQTVGVMVRGSLAKGLLAGKPVSSYMSYSIQEVEELLDVLHDLSSNDRSVGQLAIRYVLSHPAVTSAVIGIRTKEQLNEAVGVSAITLSTHERELLASTLKSELYTDHR